MGVPESMLGYWDISWSVSSLGSQVSTRASRQFMNRSTFSALQFDLVKKPANRHRPPNPQLCRKCSCCCDVSSHEIMFSTYSSKSINQSINQSINHSINQSANQLNNQPINNQTGNHVSITHF